MKHDYPSGTIIIVHHWALLNHHSPSIAHHFEVSTAMMNMNQQGINHQLTSLNHQINHSPIMVYHQLHHMLTIPGTPLFRSQRLQVLQQGQQTQRRVASPVEAIGHLLADVAALHPGGGWAPEPLGFRLLNLVLLSCRLPVATCRMCSSEMWGWN